MYDARRLRLLRELSLHGTIAATAAACSLTPSAVSQQLSLLEREVGTALFFRDGRRLVLTEAARVLVEHAERILAELEQAKASVSELTGSVRGQLRLSAFATAARALVPEAIANCRKDYPDLRIRLSDEETSEALAALKAGTVDIALIYEYNLLPEARDAGIELVPLLREPLLAALPPGTSEEDGELSLSTLEAEPWIAPHNDLALRAVMERACGLAGFVPDVAYTSDDYTVILALVHAGLGAALVPRLALAYLSSDIELRAIAEPELTRTVSAAVRAGSRRTPAIAALVDALRDIANEAG